MQKSALLQLEKIVGLLAEKLHGGFPAGAEYDLHLGQGIHVRGFQQIFCFFYGSGIGAFDDGFQNFFLGFEIIVDTSLPDARFFGNIADRYGLGAVLVHQSLHGIQDHILFSIVLHKYHSPFFFDSNMIA